MTITTAFVINPRMRTFSIPKTSLRISNSNRIGSMDVLADSKFCGSGGDSHSVTIQFITIFIFCDNNVFIKFL
jgi:hypothetical protein